MITNGKDIVNGSVLKADVCIVGTGPAGVTLAWQLQNAGYNVLLMEGSRTQVLGSQDYKRDWNDKTLLYAGTATGQFTHNEPEFLIRPNNTYSSGAWERERSYGGTSNHWGGQSRPLDAITLEGRSSDFPAWPVSRAELDPFYAEAAKFCVLETDDFSNQTWEGILGTEAPILNGFETDAYQFMGSGFLNFALRTFPDGKTIGQSNANVVYNATLLDMSIANGSISSLSFGTMTTNTPPTQLGGFTVQASCYVLAMGAVANARQMLLAGIPNDNIGRYFGCHPLAQNYIDYGGNAITVSGSFLNGSQSNYMHGNKSNGQQWKNSNGVTMQARFSPTPDQLVANNIGSCWCYGDTVMGYFFEQAPNPASRITLGTTYDKVFNQKEVVIDWQLSDIDRRTYETTTQLFTEAVQAINPNLTVTCQSWDTILNRFVVNGHHLGTTRMSDTSADGVVDKNLKSHDIGNLFVAGSSVWRTAGIPNPTFSIITFSIRLARHLATLL
jgi:hypothetical protein